jgi:hypothetical protein
LADVAINLLVLAGFAALVMSLAVVALQRRLQRR